MTALAEVVSEYRRAPENYFTVKEVARRLKITERHVHRLCADGQLRKAKLGRHAVRITGSSLYRYEAQALARA